MHMCCKSNRRWADQRVGVQQLSEDVSHEHRHVRWSGLQQLDVLERAVHLRERQRTVRNEKNVEKEKMW